ncbi:MAG: hypothetical protein WBB24_08220 [Maribacter sp.]
MKVTSPKAFFTILSFVFFSVFLSSCGKEHDLISDFVIKDSKSKISIYKIDAIDTAITQESTPTSEKKKNTP